MFLAEMSTVVPWVALEALIEPHYPKVGPQGGRRPFRLAVMLRIYCLQQWYNLSDLGAEEALYDHPVDARVLWTGTRARRDPGRDDDLHFHHLLERHDLTRAIFERVKSH